MDYNAKSTDAKGKLNPRSVIAREEGELGILIIPWAQPAGFKNPDSLTPN